MFSALTEAVARIRWRRCRRRPTTPPPATSPRGGATANPRRPSSALSLNDRARGHAAVAPAVRLRPPGGPAPARSPTPRFKHGWRTLRSNARRNAGSRPFRCLSPSCSIMPHLHPLARRIGSNALRRRGGDGQPILDVTSPPATITCGRWREPAIVPRSIRMPRPALIAWRRPLRSAGA
jgi:hypothetical protein